MTPAIRPQRTTTRCKPNWGARWADFEDDGKVAILANDDLDMEAESTHSDEAEAPAGPVEAEEELTNI